VTEEFSFVEPPPVATLDERIANTMPETQPFSMKELTAFFPNEDYWPLYRALSRLEKSRQIRYHKTVSKRKYYTLQAVNTLPHIINNADGKAHPLSVFVEQHEAFLDGERKIWKTLDEARVNRIPVLFAHLFVIANSEEYANDKELKKQWDLIRHELIEARRVLRQSEEWIDSVIEHPSMTGDVTTFREVFAGKDAPKLEAIQKFNRWIAKFWIGDKQ
jgi:hypothetical protein